MIAWVRRLFGNGHVPTDGTLHDRADETAKRSEEALKESRNTISALKQIRKVEAAAREHR